MEDTIKIRKDKVKNIAIVFLSVMLILTFFSNSILNRALPQVATAYVNYDTITERVRGTGKVVADDPYKVVVKDTRTIESVVVKVGDEVTKDQILFYLEDAESAELKEKEKEVEAKEEEVDAKLKTIMSNIHDNAAAAAEEFGYGYDLVKGANIAGFKKVAEAMMAQGLV